MQISQTNEQIATPNRHQIDTKSTPNRRQTGAKQEKNKFQEKQIYCLFDLIRLCICAKAILFKENKI